jgi:hypothetical protein
VSIYIALLSVSMVILGRAVCHMVLQQGNIIQRELWSIQRLMIRPAMTRASRLISGRRRG